MKKIIQLINAMLSTFGIKISSTHHGDFTMTAALKRAAKFQTNIETVIDIGASDGHWSKIAFKHFPSSNFLAVEALVERQKSLDALREQHSNFQYELCVAGGNDNSSAIINVSKDLDGSSVGGSGGANRTVPERTIDGIVAKYSLKGPFLLKFDTHGFELPILDGCQDILPNTNIIVMETYNFQITDQTLRFHEMCAHLEKLGFRCYDLADPMLRKSDAAFWQFDLFFVRSSSSIFQSNSYQSIIRSDDIQTAR